MSTSVTRINNMPVRLVQVGDIVDGRRVAHLEKAFVGGIVTDYVVRSLEAEPPATSEETYYTPDARVTVLRRVSW